MLFIPNSRGRASYILAHSTDVDCVTCSFVEKKRKGGRPKKLKWGKKAGGSKCTEGTTGERELPRETVLNITRKMEEIENASTVSHRLQNSTEI